MLQKILVWTLTVAVASVSLRAQSTADGSHPSSTAIRAAYGNLPFTFEVNQGQTAAQVKFLSRGPEYTAFLTSDGIALSLRPKDQSISDKGKAQTATQSRASVQFNLVGTTSHPSVIGEDLQPGQVNYFLGQDPKLWHTKVPTYGKVRYKNIYPGIDLVYYGNHRELECDFEVVPGADARLIEFEVQGASKLEVDAEQNLVVGLGKDKLTFQNPTVYQIQNSQRVPVEGTYLLKDSTHVAFRLGAFDSSKPLVIDPVLVYSTYLGGSGNDDARGIAVDASGSAYVVGFTDSADFPLTTAGSLAAGSPHVFVTKLNATGSGLVYTDYIGGNNQDFGYALALDSANNVWVTGSTQSSNFPVVHAYQGTYPGAFNAFLAKISSNGSSLLYSTYLGGNGSDVPVGVGLDATGSITIGGYTSSTNFPTANAYQSSASPNQGGFYGNYGFLSKFTPDGSALAYSTYLGGSSNVPNDCGGTPCWTEPSTNISGMSVDASGNAYVAGVTNTYNYPATPGAYLASNSTQGNSLVGFLTKVTSGGSLAYSTYFYESSGLLTNVTALAVDSTGSAYLSGQAYSDGTFPTTTTAICDPSTVQFACSYGFVTKFDPTGSTLSYSTFLGPNNWATPSSITLDAFNDAFVVAGTTSNSFGVINPIEPYTNGNDLLLVELDPTGTSQVWATYLGGSSDETLAALAVDSSGNVYVTGTTTSRDFPVTQGAFQTASAGNADVFVMKIGSSSSPAVSLNPFRLQYGSLAVGSASTSQTVLLRNMGSAALSLSSVTSTGDFAQTNDCGTTVPAAGSCSFSVTFTPTTPGQRAGTIVLQDNASGSPHMINLAGNGTGGLISVAPASLAFAGTPVGVASAPQNVTLNNSGNMTVNIASIQASGSYSQTNNCAATLAPAASCRVTVTFTPATLGPNNGTLTVNDDAVVGTQTIALTGAGSDFTVTGAPTTATVKSGSTITYQLTISSSGGTFANAVSLTCTPPAKASCSISPSSVTPGQNKATAVLTVAATSTSSESASAAGSHRPTYLALLISFPGVAIFGVVFTGREKRLGARRFVPALALFVLMMFLVGCAGGTGIIPQGGSGTPPGTYTVTVVGTSGNLQHSVPLTLVVQ